MPFDLSSLERGYGETDVAWNDATIIVRYRANLNNRAMIAMKRVMLGVTALDGVTQFPDIEAVLAEVEHVLLPSGPDVPEEERGWDLTRDGASIPVTFDELVELPPGLPFAILGAILRDMNDPNRRRPSANFSSRGADSPATASRTTSDSSRPRNGRASLPGPSEGMTTLPATPVGSAG